MAFALSVTLSFSGSAAPAGTLRVAAPTCSSGTRVSTAAPGSRGPGVRARPHRVLWAPDLEGQAPRGPSRHPHAVLWRNQLCPLEAFCDVSSKPGVDPARGKSAEGRLGHVFSTVPLTGHEMACSVALPACATAGVRRPTHVPFLPHARRSRSRQSRTARAGTAGRCRGPGNIRIVPCSQQPCLLWS